MKTSPRPNRAWPRSRAVVTLFLCLVIALGAGSLAAALAQQADNGDEGGARGPLALQADIEGAIGPASAKYLADAIETAESRNAELLLLRIDTPGGLATSMRDMIADILASAVPVIGYVAPSGARAASAGTYILYATHVAAMAPGTNMGAATPVQIGGGTPSLPSPGENGEKKEKKDNKNGEKDGEKSENGEADGAGKTAEGGDAQSADPMKRKAVNDAVAFIRSLAEMRGRNAEWAEKAVREAASISASTAAGENVIDLVAADTNTLLSKLDGREIETQAGARTLSTEGIRVERLEPSFITKALGILSNPNVALILMMIGVYGLIFEFANPGGIGPGIIGIICLVLGLYALNQLPLNYAGLALLMVGIALMVAEAFTPTFGVLGAGGVAAFVIGAALLVDTDVEAYQISWTVIGAIAAFSAIVLVFLLGYVWRAHRRPIAGGGAHQLIGAEGEVLDWSQDEGHVWAAGERWNARGQGAFEPGDRVSVQRVDGLTLEVAPLEAGTGEQRQHQGA